MSKEARQKFILQMMFLGSKFEDIYKESDGEPKWTYCVYSDKGTYNTERMTEKEFKEHNSNNYKYRRIDLLGYHIDE